MTFDRLSSAFRSSGSVWATIVAATMVAMPAWAEGCRATSGPMAVPLVELFTSEGCNSCPPADRWLSANFPAAAPVATAVALAFHVDYWDRLGWKDRFAAPEWTARQYAAARANRSSFVFTPQVLLQGKDFPEWRGGGGTAGFAAAAAVPARARIALEAEARADAIAVKATAHVPRADDRKGSALFVALADSGLVSDIKAGENAGVRLKHDHVVRALRGGFAVDGNGDVAADVPLAWPSEAGKASTVVAFVQNLESGAVLQTLPLPVSDAGCARPR